MLEAQIKWNETNSKTIIILLSFFMFVYVSTGEKYYIYIILLLSYRRNRNELWFVFFGYEVILDWETLSESQFVALSGSFVWINVISHTIIVNHIDSL